MNRRREDRNVSVDPAPDVSLLLRTSEDGGSEEARDPSSVKSSSVSTG